MKAFLLAAGDGTRLRPLTTHVPKALVPIQDRPLLELWLDLLHVHGVTDVLINLHHAHERVIEYLRDHPAAVRVTLVHEPALLGSAGTVWANRAFVKGERDFLILYADVLTNAHLGRIAAVHRRSDRAMTVGVTPTDRPQEKGTVVLGAENTIVAFEEKASRPRSNLANAGIYVASQSLFQYLEATRPREGVFDFGHHVLPRMAPDLTAYPIREFLLDIGTHEAYWSAQQLWPGLSRP